MKVDRLVSIIMTLLDKKRIGAQELADMFEVSPRTIYRDIDGLSSLSGMIRGEELVHALAKVKSFIPADRKKEIELKANQICIDLSPWIGNRNIQPYLEVIQLALQENKLLIFAYTAHHGNKTTRTAEPYQLVLKGHHWYLQGYCHKRNDFRLFRLSRMSNLQMKEEVFTPRDYQKPQLDFDNIWAAIQTRIKIRIHQSVMDRVLDYCTYEDFSPDGKEHYIVHFPFIENEYYYGILLSFGDKCECLEPLHIRTEIKRRIHDIAAIYES